MPRLTPRARCLGWPVAAVLLWFAADATTLRTTLVVRGTNDRLVFTACGATLTAPTAMTRLTGVSVTAMASIDPPRGGRLTIEDRDGVVVSAALPRHPWYRPRRPQPVGDWHVDRHAATAVLADRSTDLAAPFAVQLEIRGRALEAVRLQLIGPPTVEVRLRRGLINNDLSLARPGAATPTTTVALPAPGDARLLAILSSLLRGAAGACALLAIATLASIVGRRWRAEWPAVGAPSSRVFWGAALGLATIAVARSVWVAWAILERVPHVPDGVAYLLQARWLLAGWLVAPAPPLPAHFMIPFTFVENGLWCSQYPPAWPAVLAAGDALGAAWLVAPLLGGAFVLLLALLGREIDQPAVGLLAALLGVISPLATLLFSSYLSHAAAAPLVAAFLWLVVAADRRGRPRMAAPAGLALGLAAGMRPLTALAAAVPIGLTLIAGLGVAGRRRQSAARIRWLVAGGLAGVAPTLLANTVITGSPLRFAYSLIDSKGFYGLGRIPWGLQNLDAIVASLPSQMLGLGWGILPLTAGSAIALGLVLVPLLRREPAPGHVFLASVWLMVAAAYLGTQWSGLHGYGPRYHFEACAGLLVLAAAGIVRLAAIESEPDAATGRRPLPIITGSVIGLLVALAIVALPTRMNLYRRYNLVDGSLVAAVRELPPGPALIVFRSGRWYDWGRAAPLLPAFPAGELVFAAEAGDLHELLDAYPEHRRYLWNGHSLASLE